MVSLKTQYENMKWDIKNHNLLIHLNKILQDSLRTKFQYISTIRWAATFLYFFDMAS